MAKQLSTPAPSCHIIIVNYNAGEWLVDALTSALKHSAAKVTVVDNASTDDSVARAREAIQSDRVEWILNKQNVGFAAANNQVLSVTDATFSVLMNPDCELQEGTLQELLDAFAEHSSLGLASCRILNSDGSLQATCKRRFPTPWSALVRMLQLQRLFPNNPRFASFNYGDQVDNTLGIEYVEAVSGAFMVARMRAVRQVGMLDEGYFMHCEDLDWCKRFALANWQVGFLPNVWVKHGKGVSSQSRPIRVLYTLHKGMDRFFNKFYAEQTPLWLRIAVKGGIVLSFIGRAAVNLLKGLGK